MAGEATVCGTGLGNFPQPGDPNTNINVAGTQVFAGALVTWSFPTTNPHAVAHFNLYRSTVNDPLTMALHRVLLSTAYVDTVQPVSPTTYYYWVEVVSVSGTVGPPVGPAAVSLSPLVDGITSRLVGKVGTSHLTAGVNTTLGQIATNTSAIATEQAARIAGDNALGTTQTAQATQINEMSQDILDLQNATGTDYSDLVAQIDAVAAETLNVLHKDYTAASVVTDLEAVVATVTFTPLHATSSFHLNFSGVMTLAPTLAGDGYLYLYIDNVLTETYHMATLASGTTRLPVGFTYAPVLDGTQHTVEVKALTDDVGTVENASLVIHETRR